jgi:hypothetical protein
MNDGVSNLLKIRIHFHYDINSKELHHSTTYRALQHTLIDNFYVNT